MISLFIFAFDFQPLFISPPTASLNFICTHPKLIVVARVERKNNNQKSKLEVFYYVD